MNLPIKEAVIGEEAVGLVRMKRREPRTEPWETPDVSNDQVDELPTTRTCWFLWDKKTLNPAKYVTPNPVVV